MQPFVPLFRNPHLATIAGNFWRRTLDERRFPVSEKKYRTEPGVQVLVHSQRPASSARGELILVHGLEGSSQPEINSLLIGVNNGIRRLRHIIDDMIDVYGSGPGSLVGLAFLMMNPIGNVTKYTIDLIDVVGDEAKLLNFLRMERWIADRPDHPGEVMRQWFKDLYQENKLIRNELQLGGRTVDLRNVTMPVLNIYATGDTVIPVSCTKGVGDCFGTNDYTEVPVPGGHIGTFVGTKAQKVLTPAITEWFNARG